ncbi:MAG: recombinase family protein [Lacunisphaera sp.]|nr:recombinase family protein [Lacunisphaera sp.]
MHTLRREANTVTSGSVPVAIYTRVSTVNQVGGRFDSCESQAAVCREYISKRAAEGWHEVASFSDPAYSGGTMNRPGIQGLKRRIEAGDVKVALIFKLERVLRSTDEWSPFRSFLQKHNCRLVSTTEDLNDETPSGRLKNNLLVSVAEYERLNTAEKVRTKLLEQAKRGYWSCGLVPYGYTYDKTTQTLHQHPEEAVVVRRIFAEAASLVPLTKVANGLAADSIRTKLRVFVRRDGAKEEVGGLSFRSDGLRKLIRNSIYAGRVRMQGQQYPGLHEGLVSPDLWERANAAIKQSLQPARCLLNTRDKHFHLLKGVLHCGCCRRAMIPNASGKKDGDGRPYRYYTCGHTRQPGAVTICPVRHVSAAALEAAIIGFIGECSQHPEILQAAEESSRLRAKTNRKPLRTALAAAEDSLADITQQLRNCAEVVAVGGMDAMVDELRERAVSLRTEKQRLLVECERLRQDLSASDQDQLDATRLRESLTKFSEVLPTLSHEEQRSLVTLFIAKIEILPSGATGGKAAATSRNFELHIRFHMSRLIAGMEQKVVVQARPKTRGPLPPVRLLCLEMRCSIARTNAPDPIAILAPFRRAISPTQEPVAKVIQGAPSHPLQRALEWQRQLAAKPSLTQAVLAKNAGVAPGTLTHHLKLLQLAPDIQTFLITLKTEQELRQFSLNRMKALADLPQRQQLKRFAEMQRSQD